ncbi:HETEROGENEOUS NUCLEAR RIBONUCLEOPROTEIN-RELATED, putative [Babesia bigemina]|uniref:HETEROGENEOUS NUCLEAR RIBONUCLEOPROTEIN-RELATED, putative n=1 Tax=Babesia bigemina TaxID=5866 RepID=A0A061D8R3_BABBI|nr:HETEROGENEOUS NUCLEAR RIBONUCLEOPROTEIN-RELATED, putative [Babesia bigemina]CDR96337.1 HETEROGENEOUS NUCLEAR RIBONUCLEOPROTEIN-RELATED, putative [Babesia bigemina]|eukprot:XP_012768523.1 HETEROGENEOUS NUCLEAR RIBONUCLEOPROTEIN-RELATED, putative [Babesia bigemina]
MGRYVLSLVHTIRTLVTATCLAHCFLLLDLPRPCAASGLLHRYRGNQKHLGPDVGLQRSQFGARVPAFVANNVRSDGLFASDSRLFASGRFSFDPAVVKKRRRSSLSKQSNKSKNRWESQHSTMHELANLSSDHPTKEALRQVSLEEFVRRIEKRPERKRIPRPAEAHEPWYDAVVYLKGLPYEATEDDIQSWLSGYDIICVVLIKNENGCFTGDAYVRCSNIEERDRLQREMTGKTLGTRYVPMYRVTESAYLEYYRTGFRREPAKRNYIAPQLLVMKHGVGIEPTDVCSLKSGSRICGVVTNIYRNGVLVDCSVYESVGGLRERVFCVLMRNRIARNVGLLGQQREWLRTKDLVLFPGIKLNLYVEKVRQTTAQSSFDEDLWREHFGEPFESLNAPSSLPKRSMVYLTMDSSVSDDKVQWWERRLVDTYAKFTLHDSDIPDRIHDEEVFQRVAVGDTWLGGRPHVKRSEVAAGRVSIGGNKKIVDTTSTFDREAEEPDPPDNVDGPAYHELVREFMRDSDVDKYGTRYHGFEDAEAGLDTTEIRGEPTMEPILLNVDSPNEPAVFDDAEMSEAGSSTSTDVPFDTSTGASRVSFQRTKVSSNAPSLVLGNAADEGGPGELRRFAFREIDVPPTSMMPADNLDGLNVIEDLRRKTIAEELKVLPRTTLFDECIQLPGSGWLLRRSDVPKLAEVQVVAILRQLGKEAVKGAENSDFQNRMLLCQVIKEQGLGTGLDPKTLIAKGLYKVKQSKKKLKRIIELTKNLTGRRFTREDLDAASKSELQMLAEESLRKFAQWNPVEDVKRVFVEMYGGILSSLPEDASLEERWEALKWHVVLEIYGEQSDLKEILRDIEENDRMLGQHVESPSDVLGELVKGSIEQMCSERHAEHEPPSP